jgi:hypothetical protein
VLLCVHVDYFLLGVHVFYGTHGAHGGYVVNTSMTFNPPNAYRWVWLEVKSEVMSCVCLFSKGLII